MFNITLHHFTQKQLKQENLRGGKRGGQFSGDIRYDTEQGPDPELFRFHPSPPLEPAWISRYFLHIEKQDEESGKESGVLSEEGNEV